MDRAAYPKFLKVAGLFLQDWFWFFYYFFSFFLRNCSTPNLAGFVYNFSKMLLSWSHVKAEC